MSFMTEKKSKAETLEEPKENEYFISYISEPPTLQHIAAVSIACRLWSESDLKEDIRQYSENVGFDSTTVTAEKTYKEYEKRVLKKLADMLLPDTLKGKVSDIFLPIGMQLFKGFAKEIEEFYYYGEGVPNEDKGYCRFYDIFKMGGSVHWTMEGIIDNVTSLNELINIGDQEKDLGCLYELSCKYCLEECIPYIWKNISPDKKNELDYTYENYDYHIVAYWTDSNENKLPNLFDKLKQNDVHNIYDNNLSIEQNMISLSIFVKNPYSLKYFWNKLKEQEIHVYLEKWLKLAVHKCSHWERHEYQNCNDKTNILCFLLSQLNDKNQQKEVFQAHPLLILKALFYDWPWQRFFLPTFYIMMDYISEKDYVAVMSFISGEIKEGKEIIIEVFRKVWFKSPLKLKNSLIQFLEDSSSMIYRFIDVDDIETIFMILNYASEKENKAILFDMIESYELFTTIRYYKLSLIDTLITKYLTSREDIDHFKHRVMSYYGNDVCEDWFCENNFQDVETLFTWAFESPKEVRNFKENVMDKNKIYKSLVCWGNYEVIDRFMNWYFENEDEIHKFKKAFIYAVDEDNSSVCSALLWELSTWEQGWDYFETFVNYNIRTPEEEAEFKNMYLESVTSFLESYRFEFAHKFVNWCLGSVKKSNQFKNSFVTSEKGMKFIVHAVNRGYPVFSHPNQLIKWFSISKVSVAKLKCKLNNIELFLDNCDPYVADFKRFALFYLLDKHSGGDKYEYKEDSSDEDSDITMEIMMAFNGCIRHVAVPESRFLSW